MIEVKRLGWFLRLFHVFVWRIHYQLFLLSLNQSTINISYNSSVYVLGLSVKQEPMSPTSSHCSDLSNDANQVNVFNLKEYANLLNMFDFQSIVMHDDLSFTFLYEVPL